MSATAHINRSADIVRRQFADVHHHAATGVHKGVVFEVDEQTADRCLYRQTSRVGPLKLRQEFELPLTTHGPLVNTITTGQFKDGSITFTITPDGAESSVVDAQLRVSTNRLQAVLTPLLKANVRKALLRALAEDKADIASLRWGRVRLQLAIMSEAGKQ